jgi:hypothetical protein
VQTAELLERRKEVLEKKVNAELLKAKELLKVGNKTGTIVITLRGQSMTVFLKSECHFE